MKHTSGSAMTIATRVQIDLPDRLTGNIPTNGSCLNTTATRSSWMAHGRKRTPANHSALLLQFRCPVRHVLRAGLSLTIPLHHGGADFARHGFASARNVWMPMKSILCHSE